MFRPSWRRSTSLFTALTLTLTLLAPSAVLGARASVTVTVDAYPANVTPDPDRPLLEGFVTVGELAAFDVTVTSTSTSTVSGVTLIGTLAGSPTGTYEGTHVMAGPAQCSTPTVPRTSGFSCDLGNIPAGADPIELRVVVQTPTSPSTLTLNATGSASGSTGSDRPGQSRGDTFAGESEIEVVAPFQNNVNLNRGVGAFIDAEAAGERLTFASDGGNFGADNPLHAVVETPAFAPADIPFGTAIWFTEYNEPGGPIICPDSAPCFGQTLELHLFDGGLLPEPARVAVKYDELKTALKTLSKWQLWHFDDEGVMPPSPPVELFGKPCTFGEDDLPTNAPCGESRAFDTTDRDDAIGIVWLDRNGYIRGG